MIEIPLENIPEQIFSISIEGQAYDMRVISNYRRNAWSISIAQNGEDLINGVELLGGVDILQQHNLPFKNLYMITLTDPSQDPNLETLGTDSRLFLLTDEEAAEIEATDV